MIISSIELNTAHPEVRRETTDLCLTHSRIIDMTVGMPTDGPRVLWARPRKNLLVVRAPDPITEARLPSGYAKSISYREWVPPNEPGRWRMVAVINPGRQQHRRIKVGDTIQRIPAGMKLVPVDDLPQQASWFARRLASGRTHEPLRPVDEVATINTWRVVSAATRRSRHRKGHLIVVRHIVVEADITVHDPELVAMSVMHGVGRDKTWGCGLTIWGR